MIIRGGSVAVARLVVDFPVAWNGSIAFTWGLVPAAATSIVVVMRVMSTFFNVVTRLDRCACVFWITPALVIRMLGFCSMYVTGFKILVVLRCRCLTVTVRILFGTTTIVPFTIVRARNSF